MINVEKPYLFAQVELDFINGRLGMRIVSIFGVQIIASSFGKMMRDKNRGNAKPADLALATLQMISMNIGMLAHLLAEANGATCTLFAGNFLQRNPFTRRTLVRARLPGSLLLILLFYLTASLTTVIRVACSNACINRHTTPMLLRRVLEKRFFCRTKVTSERLVHCCIISAIGSSPPNLQRPRTALLVKEQQALVLRLQHLGSNAVSQCNATNCRDLSKTRGG